MENRSVALRVAASLTYTLAIVGAGSVFWDIWEFKMLPSWRTLLLLAVQFAIVLAAAKLPAFVRTHAARAFKVQALTFLIWALPWTIYLLEQVGFLQSAWRKVNGPYFVMLVSASLIVGMAVATYCVEAIQDALEGKVRESLVRRSWFRR